MKIHISTVRDGCSFMGQHVRLTLDRELIKPNSFEGQLKEGAQQYNDRNYFTKYFQVGSNYNRDDYDKKLVECIKLIKKYIEDTWGRFLDKNQYINALMDGLINR